MKGNVKIATGVGIAVIIGVIIFQVYDTSYQRTSADEYYENLGQVKNVVYPENQQTLRGLTINKDKYLLGENIFMTISKIPPGLKDSVEVFSPEGIKYYELKFDGDKQDFIKYYFKPSLLLRLNLCDKDRLAGEWTMNFAGLPDEKLHFQVMNEILPHSEEYYEKCGEALTFPDIEPSLKP